MGNTESGSDEETLNIVEKALIPFRVRNNGFQVDYRLFKFRNLKKAKIDIATDSKYDDSFLELNTRAKVVGDIRKIFTISAEDISDEYSHLRRNYYSRIMFGIFTFIIGFILTNIGIIDIEEPKGRIMIIFGALLLVLCLMTIVIVIYTSYRLSLLNKTFIVQCVHILEKERIVSWGASFQHLLFDIKYPYAGKTGEGVVEIRPNPYIHLIQNLNTDEKVEDIDIKISQFTNDNLPIPKWAIEESQSLSIVDGKYHENVSLLNDKKHRRKRKKHKKKVRGSPSHSSDEISISPVPSQLMDDIIQEISENEEESNLISEESDDDDDDESESVDNIREAGSKKIAVLSKLKMNFSKLRSRKSKYDKKFGVSDVAPKPYTGLEHVSKDVAERIHGACAQNYFLEQEEDAEGHGEMTEERNADDC